MTPLLLNADKIADRYPNSMVVLLDNKKLAGFISQQPGPQDSELSTSTSTITPFEVFSRVGAGWKKEPTCQMTVADGAKGWTSLRETFFTLFQQQAQRTLVDFDDHLDDLTKDYLNPGLKSLGKTKLPGQLR